MPRHKAAAQPVPVWRRVAAILLGIGTLSVVFLFVARLLPKEIEALEATAEVVAGLEGAEDLNAIVAVDLAIVLQMSAFIFSGLALVFLSQLIAAFFASAVSLILNSKFAPVKVSDALPPWRWFALPFLGFAISLACTRLYAAV